MEEEKGNRERGEERGEMKEVKEGEGEEEGRGKVKWERCRKIGNGMGEQGENGRTVIEGKENRERG